MIGKKHSVIAWLTYILLAGIGITPMLVTGWISIQRISLKTPWLNNFFTGWTNYSDLILDTQFCRAWVHTIFFVWATLILEIIAGFVIAYGIYRAKMAKKYLVQIALFLPLATPAVLSGQMWRLFFHDTDGLANHILHHIFPISKDIPWLSDPWLAWIAIGVAEVWKLTPFVVLIFLSGLLRIPKEIWEASVIDGAGCWTRLFYIAVPLLRPSFLVVCLFRILDGLRVFDLIYVLTQGGPGGSTDVLGLYIYRLLFGELKIGLGAAGCVLLLLTASILAIVIVPILGRSKTYK